MYQNRSHCRQDVSFIAVDWGANNFRAYAVDTKGQVRQRTKAHQGVLRIKEDNFAPTLKRLLGKWFNKYPDIPIIMCGMIGSRHGWQEVDFVDAPVACDELATCAEKIANHRFERDIYIVPGVMMQRERQHVDVMRGEETQVFGILDSLPPQARHYICLPGHHTKWVEVVDGRINNFHTFVSTEIAALLSRQGLLSVLMNGTQYSPDEFYRGLELGRQSQHVLSDVFSVRSEGLVGTIADVALGSYLMGVLMGNEFRSVRQFFPEMKKFVVAAAPWMYDMYQQVCTVFELEMEYEKNDSATVQGLFKIYQQLQQVTAKCSYENKRFA